MTDSAIAVLHGVRPQVESSEDCWSGWDAGVGISMLVSGNVNGWCRRVSYLSGPGVAFRPAGGPVKASQGTVDRDKTSYRPLPFLAPHSPSPYLEPHDEAISLTSSALDFADFHEQFPTTKYNTHSATRDRGGGSFGSGAAVSLRTASTACGGSACA